MIYYIIYIPFILCGCFDTEDLSQKQKKIICYFWVVVLTLFWGLRWDCGTDWQQFHDDYYLSHFKNVFSFDRGLSEQLEPGYVFINAIFNEVGVEYSVFLLFFSFLISFFFARFCLAYSKWPIMSFVYLILSMGIIFPNRQALAAAILTLGTKFIFQGNYKSFFRFLFVVIIASSIHTSALFGIILFVIPKIILTLKKLLIVAFLVGVILFFLPSIMDYFVDITSSYLLISGRLESYTNLVSSMGEDFSSRGIMSYALSLFFLLAYLLKKYNVSTDKVKLTFFNGYIVQESIRYVFADLRRDFMRLEFYFHPYSTSLACELFGSSSSLKEKILLRLVYMALMIYFFYKMLTGIFVDLYIPYNSIL